MRSDELTAPMDDTGGPDDAAALGGPCPGLAPAPPGRLGAPYCEAWGYFHLAPARPGHAAGQWATCRLCGEQVSRGPGFHAGTPALWRHLKSAHRRELEKSSARRSPPGPPCPPQPQQPQQPPPGPAVAAVAAVAAEGDWARLLEQMGALAVRCSLRERELARREAAVEQGERALERRRRALQEEERAAAQARRELQAEREALQARLREVSRREGALAAASAPPQTPLKEEPEGERDDFIITKVLL
ncbi:zinc finger BED domain-containing protein 3 [Zalophus californianus]|uniref:Zinc finger BED domain-containing protein 3 n=1 Tax=Zalophus californianus TaxID=9704 RepID=A0A6J2DVV6_ZALCA|nr:zinc finger BED domain-containing protein 3 [Zalophus californianus]XP_027460610.1 zinc finger BED domain-containing protein 3 [Zalophus californianus]XP_027460611.1 zinc finger BED domain-containing protein 3 [Zalophus californianus]XP_027460612.1 zinc finger BED domain-containing protein 3 [Zalophus californianus]XP_027460613.1 zinc finger BED domain-containing protein 3 [Zalophus californianus]XP_027460614.1 zinc finger BED domain-containing protein 3 [Zalophus californianus]XP_02746061